MKTSVVENYQCDSKRGKSSEKVICIVLDSPNDLLKKNDNAVLVALSKAGLSSSIGVYFYRFANSNGPFIKIGETIRPGGIGKRFIAGWHKQGTDTYLKKRRRNELVDSEFRLEEAKISPTNPAYFVFYEHSSIRSHTKADEMYAFVCHRRFFKQQTLIPEKPNGNSLLGRALVFHRAAFSEVLGARFPSGNEYPQTNNSLQTTVLTGLV